MCCNGEKVVSFLNVIRYECAINIEELIKLSDVMSEHSLGPNGGKLVYEGVPRQILLNFGKKFWHAGCKTFTLWLQLTFPVSCLAASNNVVKLIFKAQ